MAADGYGTAPAKEILGALGKTQAQRNELAESYGKLPEHCFSQCLCGTSRLCDHCGGSGRKAPETRERVAIFL